MIDAPTFKPERDAFTQLAEDAFFVEQAGALCLRKRQGVTEVLLVGSLRTGRWGIPKGHLEENETTRAAAEREAFEEGGVRGIISPSPVGGYFYRKSTESGILHVRVHLIEVQECLSDYPEKSLRNARWVPLETAAITVARHGLRKLLLDVTRREQLKGAEGAQQ